MKHLRIGRRSLLQPVGRATPSRRSAAVLALVLLSITGVCLIPGAGDSTPADPPFYVKKATWQESMRASLAALRSYYAEHGHRDFDPVQISPWHLAGPFAAEELSEIFFPESAVDLHASDNRGAPLWTERPDITDGRVCPLPGGPGTTKYLYRTITVPWEMTVTGSFSSNDRMEAWLNGKTLFLIDRVRGCTPDRDRVPLRLVRGENRLLIKVNLKTGAAGGFYFEVLPDPDAPASMSFPPVKPVTAEAAQPPETDWEQKEGIWAQRYRKMLPEPLSANTLFWTLLRRDFPGERARREMAWEQEDRIFAGKFDPENLKDQANRYVSAMRDNMLIDRATGLAARLRTTQDLDELRALYYRNHEGSEAWEHIRYFDFKALRAAISDLKETFPAEYSNAEGFLVRLKALEADHGALTTQFQSDRTAPDPEKVMSVSRELTALRREALASNPLVSGQPILYVVRQPYWGAHGPTNTEFQNGEDFVEDTGGLKAWRSAGSALKLLSLDSHGRVLSARTLVEAPEGMIRDPDIDFEAKRIVFSMRRNRSDDYHVYEIQADGRQLRQLTWGSELSDLDPIYMPNGSIVFSSTRDVKYCHCNIHIQPNLFRMEADGANVVQIGGAPLWEGNPSLMPDGRILYSRWEYVDRQFGCSFGMWTMNPDGTNHALYYGNNSWAPGAIVDPQVIPGTSSVVCIYTGVHDMPWGSLVVLDRRLGLDGDQPVQRIWPASARANLRNLDNLAWTPADIDRFNTTLPKYEDPWPLYARDGKGAGKYFLVARSIGTVNHHYGSTEKTNASRAKMGIFLVDLFGNELLLHYERPGCFDPMPVRERARPISIPSRVDYTKTEGFFYVQDVYRGEGMAGVERGKVKYLRIVEAPPKRHWASGRWGIDAAQPPAMNWNVTISKAVIGDVEVEQDGSAYFSVPANRYVYFQALDEKKMMIQSMRSGTIVQPGETQGCVGCHESRLSAAPSRMSKALSRPPAKPQPWYGQNRDFNYLTEVQPVFNRHCVGCHDFGKPAGEVLNLSGDLGPVFNASYVELHGKSALRWAPRHGQPKLLIHCIHDGPPAVLPPYSWGSHLSRLVDVVAGGHQGVTVPREDFERIVTWIDLNGPYYGAYETAFGDNPFARSPITRDEYGRLARIIADQGGTLHRTGCEINFTRPELSPALRNFKDRASENFAEALRIVRLGKERLLAQPREDELGSATRPVRPADLSREERYTRQFRLEEESRRAVLTGNKAYPYRPLRGGNQE